MSIANCCRIELHIFTYCLNSFSSPSIVAWSPSPVMIRMHPFFAKLRAIPSPIPLVEPVTKATFPVKSITGTHCSLCFNPILVIFQTHTYGHSIQYLRVLLWIKYLIIYICFLYLSYQNTPKSKMYWLSNRFYNIFSSIALLKIIITISKNIISMITSRQLNRLLGWKYVRGTPKLFGNEQPFSIIPSLRFHISYTQRYLKLLKQPVLTIEMECHRYAHIL